MDNDKEMLKKEAIKAFQELVDYATHWLEDSKVFTKYIVNIANAREEFIWCKTALENTPEGVEEWVFTEELVKDLKKRPGIFTEQNPFPTQLFPEPYPSTSASAVYDSQSILSRILESDDNLDPGYPEHKKTSKESYISNQEKQHRVEQVKELLQQLNPSYVGLLETAEKSKKIAVAQGEGRQSAGTGMRNVLEHYKGNLFAKPSIKRPYSEKNQSEFNHIDIARLDPKISDGWEKMAKRIVSSNDVEDLKKLILEGKNWHDLQNDLSVLLKVKEGSNSIDIGTTWVKLIDHLFVVLSLVKLD